MDKVNASGFRVTTYKAAFTKQVGCLQTCIHAWTPCLNIIPCMMLLKKQRKAAEGSCWMRRSTSGVEDKNTQRCMSVCKARDRCSSNLGPRICAKHLRMTAPPLQNC